MKIIKWIASSFVVAAVLTALAIVLFPEARPVNYIIPLMKAGIAVTIGLTVISFYYEGEMTEKQKYYTMAGFLTAIMIPTLYTAGAFMHESETSWSSGEIHYHADYEVLVEQDGNLQRTNLVDPAKFCQNSNHESTYMCKMNDRTGSKEYHEHNDQRIHLEGVFKTRKEASLAAFFETFGGELTNDRLVYPTNDGRINVTNDGQNSLKILVQKGRTPDRYWCVVGEAENVDTCESYGRLADSPSYYVVSANTQNPAEGVALDNIFIIYDSSSAGEAVQDLEEDGNYRGFGLKKAGEGYDG